MGDREVLMARQDVMEGGLPGIPLEKLPRISCGTQAHDHATRFAAQFPEYVEEEKSPTETAAEWWARGGWYGIPYHLLAQTFTREDLLQLWWGTIISTSIDEHLADGTKNPLDHVFWKVHHSMFMWGWVDDFRIFAEAYEGIRRLNFGPGFDVRLDHTLSINERGTAVYSRNAPPKPLWLDGEFGLLVYHKGKHVLTVGFSVTGFGILIHQVQLREKKGNRFLYQLPRPYLEHALDCFLTAFPRTPILLIDGAEAVRRIRLGYGTRAADFDATGAAARIQQFYDQPMLGFGRVPALKGVHARCCQVVPVAADATA